MTCDMIVKSDSFADKDFHDVRIVALEVPAIMSLPNLERLTLYYNVRNPSANYETGKVGKGMTRQAFQTSFGRRNDCTTSLSTAPASLVSTSFAHDENIASPSTILCADQKPYTNTNTDWII